MATGFETCREHDGCLVVYENAWNSKCPICTLGETVDELNEHANKLLDRATELEDEIAELEAALAAAKGE